MKRYSWLSYLILVSVFFPIGFWTGSQLSPQKQKGVLSAAIQSLRLQSAPRSYPLPSDPHSARPLPRSSTPAENLQTNTLILFVDDLNAQHPRLESAWLLVHPAGTSRLIFLPIFEESTPAEDLIAAFQLEGKNLSKRFLKLIEKREILWHSFVVLDQTVQKHILTEINPSAQPQQITAIETITSACQSFPLPSQTLQRLKSLIPEHASADFDLGEAIDLWQYHFSGNPDLLCEYPTLSK